VTAPPLYSQRKYRGTYSGGYRCHLLACYVCFIVSDSSRPSTREKRELNVKGFGGFIVSVALVMALFLAQNPGVPKQRRILFTNLFIVFGCFVVSILVFAMFYQYLYKADALHFFFNEAITQRQKEIVQSKSTQELALLAKKIVLMSELLTALLERKATVLAESAPYDVVLPSGVRYGFRSMPATGGAPMPGVLLSVLNENGIAVLDEFLISYPRCPERNAEEFITVAKAGIQSFSRRSLELEERIGSLSTESPKVWSLIDFIYFSTIIQATVGFGDILPNSSLVRLLVVLQVLIGYGILMVALNMVMTFH
jgi:hypothetical protein